ncbi:FtsK/SpoIIIE domain-containing protein [Dactylosporangium sp. McL0621]|uniref:FtsK/SpoIIIE domain-containing protein n=1 Tax=Dactylosporangium sp. McL0621 TaxID=3415678 RepID=UPI003CF10196
MPEDRLGEVRDLLEAALAPAADYDAAQRLVRLADEYQPDVVREAAEAALRIVAHEVPPPPHGHGGVAVPPLWGIGDAAAFDPAKRWAEGAAGPVVPVGVAADGSPVALDLREGAEGGAGPHALVVGATGSGKSELLRTLVLGLAVHNPPDELALLLVDHRGGASFAEFENLPHVAGLALNLWELRDLRRLAAVIQGELRRRQELFRDAGVANIGQYRADGHALPRLVAVFEDFSDLMTSMPEFLDTFTTVARIGRSLGVHLVLASQRLEEGRLRGLDAHLSCRVALRTFSAMESRQAIGLPDAYELPPAPGHGLLREGPGSPVRFRAAYCGFAYHAGPPSWEAFIRARRHPRPGTVLSVLLERLAAAGGATRQLWLPPLEERIPLGAVLRVLLGDRRLVPIGVLDLPREHARRPFAVDLRGDAGHLAVVGAPGSGRRTALLTLVHALARLLPPQEARVYAILHGDAPARPHVAASARHADPDAVRRVAAEVAGIVADRHGAPGVQGAHVLLVVEDLAALEPETARLLDHVLHEGPRLGVHVAASAGRWADLGPAARLDAFRQRVELRLENPSESAIDRRAAHDLPYRSPGHGLTAGGHRVLIAEPEPDL